MKEYDVIVIGTGLAGLMAATVAAGRGKSVLVLTKGTGTIAIGGGTIDVLGYGPAGRPVASPASAALMLPDGHPYRKIGWPQVEEALRFFLELTGAEGYPYGGSADTVQWLPTVAGTLKPSCLVPKTMEPGRLAEAGKVVAAGFSRLKDYHPRLVAEGVKRQLKAGGEWGTAVLETGLGRGRDLTALEIARWLDGEDGRQAFIRQVRELIGPGCEVLLPPVLGTKPDYRLAKHLEEETGCRFIETVGLPTAVTGLRLRNLLVSRLKKQGVTVVEQANVAEAVIDSDLCRAVVTRNIDRDRSYAAKEFILATGGFLGGGLHSGVGWAKEMIFRLPVQVTVNQEEWGNTNLFSPEGQPFARFGLAVDESLRPVDREGNLLLANVRIIGRNLAGYDHCLEKSGNGVAVASGYLAGILV